MIGATGPRLRGVAFASGTANSLLAGAMALEPSNGTRYMARECQDDLRFYHQQKKFEKAIPDKIKAPVIFSPLPDEKASGSPRQPTKPAQRMVVSPVGTPLPSGPLEEKGRPAKPRVFAQDDIPVRYYYLRPRCS